MVEIAAIVKFDQMLETLSIHRYVLFIVRKNPSGADNQQERLALNVYIFI